MSLAPQILIAASGTGGHLFPALFIAQEIQRQCPQAQIQFVGSGRPLEETIIGGAGFSRSIIAVRGVKHRGLGGYLRFLINLPKVWHQARCLLDSFKPDLVLGVGGYVTVVPILEACRRRIPTWIHEAEIKPGLANSLLMRWVSVVSVAFPETSVPGAKDVRPLGQPIRPALNSVRKGVASGAPRNLLIIGGSQGAKALDEALPQLGSLLSELHLSVRHQCRPENVAAVKAAYLAAGIKAEVVPFITDMPAALGWADVVVSRAGASSVMEIEAVNVPAIFVPYPFRTENHQLDNAKVLERVGKALVVTEGEAFTKRLEAALRVITEPAYWAAMIAIDHECRSLGAAQQIASGILSTIAQTNQIQGR